MFQENKKKKYNRQIVIEGIGEKGQEKLLQSKVLVVGAGGLGSGCLYYLTAAGVGEIGILDKDKVELSNLNRQILFNETDIGKLKVESAKNKLQKLNKDVEIHSYQEEINGKNASKIIQNYDFVIEASDNFETKFLVNDTCVKLGIPFSIGGVITFEGQLLTVIPHKTACYRCIFKKIPKKGTYKTTKEMGIMGTTAGFFGIIETNEAIKYLIYGENDARLLTDKILFADLQYNTFEVIQVQRDKKCFACGSE